MASIYENAVKVYGRRWQRPWAVFVLCLTLLFTLHWLAQPKPDEPQVMCEYQAGSRYRAAVESHGLVWTADFQAGLACALKHDRFVLLAFHAVTDVNAQLNEHTIFPDPRVKSAMRRYVLVMLHVDVVPVHFYLHETSLKDRQSDGAANYEFEQQTFGTGQEPMYVVLRPTGNGNFTVVAVNDEGLINDPARFVGYLQNPLRSARRFGSE